MFERHARTVSFLTLGSRVLGLVREATLSRVFGAGPLMDAFFFAFMVPNLFRRLFGEGALAAAFLPEYARLDHDDPPTARRLATLTVGVMIVGLGGLVVVGEILLAVLSTYVDSTTLVARLMMITLPYMPMVCIVAILGAMLQVHGRFGPPAAAPIVLNVCMIATAIGVVLIDDPETWDERVRHAAIVAASVVLAGLLQIAWCAAALRERRWWHGDARRDAPAREALGRVLRKTGPMVLGLGVLQINTFFDAVIASYPVTFGPEIFGRPYPLTEGAMATIGFAQRLYMFPLGVFGIAIATAIFPMLARQAADPEGFGATLRRGLRLVVFIGLPASAGLVLVREPLVAVVLEGGRFGADDTRRVGFALLGYAPAVWAYSMSHVLTRAYYARGDVLTPIRVAVGMVVLNIALNVTLIWTPLREAGLAWSTATCAVIQCVILVRLMRRHSPHVVDARVVASWIRSTASTVAMIVAVVAMDLALPDATSWPGSLGLLLALVVTGTLAYAVPARLFGMPELRWAAGVRNDAE